MVAGVVEVHTKVVGEGHAIERSNIQAPAAIEDIHQVFLGLECEVSNGVGNGHHVTGGAHRLAVTVVVEVIVAVLGNGAVGITYVERIDRTEIAGNGKCITRGVGSGLFPRIFAGSVGVHEVSAQFHPLLHLIVNIQAGGDTAEPGAFDDTIISEVTCTEIVGQFVTTANDAGLVLLAESVRERKVFPVIGGVIVSAVGIAKCSVGIDCAVNGHQVLSGRNSVNTVSGCGGYPGVRIVVH